MRHAAVVRVRSSGSPALPTLYAPINKPQSTPYMRAESNSGLLRAAQNPGGSFCAVRHFPHKWRYGALSGAKWRANFAPFFRFFIDPCMGRFILHTGLQTARMTRDWSLRDLCSIIEVVSHKRHCGAACNIDYDRRCATNRWWTLIARTAGSGVTYH